MVESPPPCGGGDFNEDQQWKVDALVLQLQPHPRAEAHRANVFRYICKHIRHIVWKEVHDAGGAVDDMAQVQVHRFGSVPLKTYLPHGDLDVTAFAPDDKWLSKLKETLEAQARLDDAQCVVSGVYSVPHDLNRPAHAEVVKVVKCQIDGISVDISANALGGLFSLCLLEKVDQLIGEGHLFKRATVLVKAWCYFEARILSSQNGLLATYALETLVVCIFNLFGRQLSTPLDVLAKFLEYFSQFDWAGCCLTVRGPVPLKDLKDGSVPELPDDASQDKPTLLLLSDEILESDEQLKTIMRAPTEDQRQFQWKHLNICDPLDRTNNLGRSVSRGNACRIRRAFLHGSRSLQAVLRGSSEGGLHSFFLYTMRTLTGHRPDVGDLCITGDLRQGTSTMSNRSTDLSTMSRSSGGTSEVPSDDEEERELQARRQAEGGNTSLNTALNMLLTKSSLALASGGVPALPGALLGAQRVPRSEGADGVGGEEVEGAAAGGEPASGGDEREGAGGYDDCDSVEAEGSPEVKARSTWGGGNVDVLAADLDELMADLSHVMDSMQRLHGTQEHVPVTVARSAALVPQVEKRSPAQKPEGGGGGKTPKKSGDPNRSLSPVLDPQHFPALGGR